MTALRKNGRLLGAAMALATLSVCGGGDSGSGSGPTVPIPPVPTPTPAPAPGVGAPLSASCARMGLGDPKASCRTEAATFLGDVNQAIDSLRSQRPDIFDGDRVLNSGAYYVGLIKLLDQEGLCTGTDGEEFGVKSSNDYSDVFDLLTAKSQVRRFYVGTCYPAIFPEAEATLPPPPAGCNLPSSRLVACGVDGEGRYTGDVTGAIDQMLKEKPQLFDFDDINPGTNWPRLKDANAYQQGVVDILVKKGYCAIFDGEEITVKRTNDFTEHFDINYSDRYVRNGPGTYRGSCYPAAF